MAPPVSERCKIFDRDEFFTGADKRQSVQPGPNSIVYIERGEAPYLTIQIQPNEVFVRAYRRSGEDEKSMRSCAYRFSIRQAEYAKVAVAIDAVLKSDPQLADPEAQSHRRGAARGCHILRGATLDYRSPQGNFFDTTTCRAGGKLITAAYKEIVPLLQRHGASLTE